LKPRNRRRWGKFLLRPWFLKFLMIDVAPVAVKVAQVVIEIRKLFGK
jgi:hypothetical protein